MLMSRGSDRAGGEYIRDGSMDFVPPMWSSAQTAILTINNPRFLMPRTTTPRRYRSRRRYCDLRPDDEICVLRGGMVDHPKYKGRNVFSAGITLTISTRGDSVPLVHHARHGRGEQDAAGVARPVPQPHEMQGGTHEKLGSRSLMCSRSAAAASICWRWTTLWGQRCLHDASGAQGGHHSRRCQSALSRFVGPVSRDRPS